MAKIEIYRYGRYINSVETQEELRDWILNNIPYENTETVIPPMTPLNACLRIAEEKHYSFKMPSPKEKMDEIVEIVETLRIEDVAKEYVELKSRGENFTFKCPLCEGGETGYISPKFQIFKCFHCGKSGNVIDFFAMMENLTPKDAIKKLKKKYNI